MLFDRFAATAFIIFTLCTNAPTSHAQTSVSIGEGFECATYGDGSKALGTLSDAGFVPVDSKVVVARGNKELRKIRAKEERLSAILNAKKSRINQLLTGFLSLFIADFPNSGVATFFEDTQERKEVVRGVREFTRQRKKALNAFLTRAKKCKGVAPTPPQNGDVIAPTLKVVSFRGGQTAYAGFLALTSPRRPRFASKPGGFNICLRVETTNPSTGEKTVQGFYTGVDTEVCDFGGGVVDDNAVVACNATVPAKLVGYFILSIASDDLSDENLARLEGIALQNPPTVRFLALDQFKGSRDQAVQRCEIFARAR